MNTRWRTLVLMLLLGAGATPTLAAEFVAPYVVTPKGDVEAMLALADVGPGDYLIDLGSGDGRIVIGAGLRGAAGHGVELDRDLVDRARQNARAAEVDDRVTFLQQDIFEADISQATVITAYLMPEVNLRLRPRLLSELTPGTRVLSNSFDMGEWHPDRTMKARVSGGILLWVVPAGIDGEWSVNVDERRFVLTVEQHFQEFGFSLAADGAALHPLETTLSGDRISFAAGDGRDRYLFSGRVEGTRMRGFVQIHGVDDSRVTRWHAVRRGSITATGPSERPLRQPARPLAGPGSPAAR